MEFKFKSFIVKESETYPTQFRILDLNKTSVSWEKPTYYLAAEDAVNRIIQYEKENFK